MYMSQVERNERLAVGISDIPSTVPLDVLARLPFDDQPDSEIDATLYQEKGQSYYSIFVAVTRLGLLKRALDFVQQHGGRPSLHPVCIFREAKRGRDVRLPRQFVPEMLDLLEPSKFKLKASEIPFNLAVMAFLTDQHKTYAHQQEEYGSALDESDQLVRLPLTQAQKKAKAAAREVDRLEKIARQAVFHKQELEQRQQDIQTARQGAPPPTDEEAIYEFSRYSEIEAATRKAYLDILAFERAREKAELAHEIVLLQHEFQHDDHGDFFIQHTMIYPPDGTTVLPFAPSELADPTSMSLSVERSRRWRFPYPLSEEEERECTLHITDVLTEEGFHRDHYSITYHSDEDEDRYLQLIFSLTSDYFRTQSLELTFKTHRLELASSVAPLPDQMTVVGMKYVSGFAREPNPVVANVFDRALAEYVVLENVWRLDLVMLNNKKVSTCKINSFIALVSFKTKPNGDGELYNPTDLPGWVTTAWHDINPLHVLGRAPCCIKCTQFPSTNIPKYHTTEQCSRSEASLRLEHEEGKDEHEKGEDERQEQGE